MTHRRPDETTVARAMKALAEIEAGVETPPRVEAAVMAKWDADHAPRARSRTSGFVRGAATTAAGITLLGVLLWQRGLGMTSTRDTTAVGGPSHGATPVVTPADATVPAHEPAAFTFVGEPPLANEPVWIIRMRVAPSALTELGIRSTTQADTIEIDVLVGEDGVARGVRMSM